MRELVSKHIMENMDGAILGSITPEQKEILLRVVIAEIRRLNVEVAHYAYERREGYEVNEVYEQYFKGLVKNLREILNTLRAL